MPLCGPAPNPYGTDRQKFPAAEKATQIVDGAKLERLLALQETCKQFLATKLNVAKYKSAKEAVNKSIRDPKPANIQEAFEATIVCAQTIAQYLVLKDQIFCALLSLIDGINCVSKFGQNPYDNATKFLNPNVENSMHIIRNFCGLLFQFNSYLTHIYPANDIASYKRMANQINNDKEGKYSEATVKKAIESNEGDLKRLKDVEVQYDIAGMYPVFQTAGQYWNFQYDEQFKPTVYRYDLNQDAKTLQERVDFLVAAAQCFHFRFEEHEAAAFCLATAHQFLNKMENEKAKAKGAVVSEKQFAGVLDKQYPYQLLQLLQEMKTRDQFEVVRDVLGGALGLKETKAKEAKLLQ